jgi:hypothetical protein
MHDLEVRLPGNNVIKPGESSAGCLLHAGFLFDFILDPEDGGDIFPRNIG